MLYNATTPDEYLKVLEDDWRKEKLLAIREMILKASNAVSETIEYKMLAYKMGSNSIFHLNAQKNYVSLYVGDIKKVEAGAEMLKGIDFGKGCIRLKKSNKLADTGMEAFIQKLIQIWEEGGETKC